MYLLKLSQCELYLFYLPSSTRINILKVFREKNVRTIFGSPITVELLPSLVNMSSFIVNVLVISLRFLCFFVRWLAVAVVVVEEPPAPVEGYCSYKISFELCGHRFGFDVVYSGGGYEVDA